MIPFFVAAVDAAQPPTGVPVGQSSGQIEQPKSIWEGGNPFLPSHTLSLFLLQVIIIIGLCRFLGLLLKRLHQPRVIAEVIGGILLGPSAFGKIPGFTSAIFPSASIPYFKLVADFGLVLYLFLVGLELDPRLLKRNIGSSIAISVAGIILPFAAGIGVSFILYQNLMPENTTIPFTSFFLFLGVAMSITAFPVLARILTEKNILRTQVGMTTISAAAVDDFVAWSLLALVIAIINAANGLSALYTFLAVIGYALVLMLGVRPILIKLISWSSANQRASEALMFATLLLVFASAMYTEVIGVHAIFGGFIVGCIIPHESGFAIALTEKIEDLVTIVFLPLYFAASGLKTNLSLLDDGIVWAMLVLVVFVACAGKIIGCTLSARFSGLSWTGSLSVGILMNTKGLVELIVLNLGRDAGVISDRIFVVMVLMALVTTFMTSPLIEFLRHKLPDSEIGDMGKNDTEILPGDGEAFKLLICLDNMEAVPTQMTLVQALRQTAAPGAYDKANVHHHALSGPLQIHATRLMPLTQRNSAVMMMANSEDALSRDVIAHVFQTFGMLNRIPVHFNLLVGSEGSELGASTVATAAKSRVDLAIVPYSSSVPGGRTLAAAAVFRASIAGVALGLLVDRGFGAPTKSTLQHTNHVASSILFVFLGGEDDRECVDLIARLILGGQHNVQILRVRYGIEEARLDAPLVSPKTPASGLSHTISGARSRKKSGFAAFGRNRTDSDAAIDDGEREAGGDIAELPAESAFLQPQPQSPLVSSPRKSTHEAPHALDRTVTKRSDVSSSPDDLAFQFLVDICKSKRGSTTRVTIEEYEHPEPHRFAASRAAALDQQDIVIVGRRHAVLRMLALAEPAQPEPTANTTTGAKKRNSNSNIPALVLQRSDDRLLEPSSSSLLPEGGSSSSNVERNQTTTRSLIATLLGRSGNSPQNADFADINLRTWHGANPLAAVGGDSAAGANAGTVQNGAEIEQSVLGTLGSHLSHSNVVNCSILVFQGAGGHLDAIATRSGASPPASPTRSS